MRLRKLAVTCALLAVVPYLHAQTYPARPIRVVVPVPPGGIVTKDATDVVANSPSEFHTFIQSEAKRWAKVVKDSGMRAD